MTQPVLEELQSGLYQDEQMNRQGYNTMLYLQESLGLLYH